MDFYLSLEQSDSNKFPVVKIITLSKTVVKVHKVFFKVQRLEKRVKYAILMLVKMSDKTRRIQIR